MLKQNIYLLLEVFVFAEQMLEFKHFIPGDFCEFSIHSIPSSTRINIENIVIADCRGKMVFLTNKFLVS